MRRAQNTQQRRQGYTGRPQLTAERTNIHSLHRHHDNANERETGNEQVRLFGILCLMGVRLLVRLSPYVSQPMYATYTFWQNVGVSAGDMPEDNSHTQGRSVGRTGCYHWVRSDVPGRGEGCGAARAQTPDILRPAAVHRDTIHDSIHHLGGVEAMRNAEVDDVAHGGRVQVDVPPEAEREQRRLVACPDDANKNRCANPNRPVQQAAQ